MKHQAVTGGLATTVSPGADDLWAKLELDSDRHVMGWHSLVDHSADVATVLLALLDRPIIRMRLARLAGRKELDSSICWRLAALAFLHDIGKANRGFRARVDPSAPLIGHIDQVAWLYHSSFGASYGERVNAILGTERWKDWFASEAASQLFDTIFAHHGRPWQRDSPPDSAVHWRPGRDFDPVADLGRMRVALDRWFPVAFQPGPALPDASAFHHAFAGLLMLADWLGSDKDLFPFAHGRSTDRFEEATHRARIALDEIGLNSDPPRAQVKAAGLDFAATFAGRRPRPMQTIVTSPEAHCVVLEAETGSGKTEAALWRFKHLFQQGEVDGLYFALPTRVAATAMFARVKMFRDRVFGGSPPAVVLAVPGQSAADDAEGRALPAFGFEWDDLPDNGKRRARWAAEHPKRFLAAPIAVGTIDQALLGAVRVKHAHMRAAALLRHLLVVDEVHASDRYMESLLSALLRNHLGAGGHALLLSATLGAGARARLLGTPCPGPAEAEAVPYPALSWAEGEREHRHTPDLQAQIDTKKHAKDAQISTAPLLDGPEEIARVAMRAAEAGAKVLVIRNTVRAAVATARALEVLAGSDHPALFRLGEVPTVHHSRFAAPDRRGLDGAVEAALGREREAGGRVVVGTQTLEVSLDLDADLLLTDLCPVDVLLQRLGRLHRNRGRARPPGFEVPRAIVLVPGSRDLLPFAKSSNGRHGLGRWVYGDLRVIEATWRRIEAASVWSIPAMNRHLVERATHPAHLDRVAADLVGRDAAWVRHIQDKEGEVVAQRQAAEFATLNWSEPFEAFRLDADANERVVTRLGTQDRLLNLSELRPELRGPFGLPVSTLRVPHYLLDGVPAEAEPEAIEAGAGTIHFRLGARLYRYDRLGLDIEAGRP